MLAGVRSAFAVGAVMAFIAALVSIKFLTKYFEHRRLFPFAAYCVLAGGTRVAHFL